MLPRSETTCAVWGTPATEIFSGRDGHMIVSSRAGGQYFITGSAMPAVTTLSVAEKAKLTSYIADQNKLGAIPEVSTFTIENLKARRGFSAFERSERLLFHLADSSASLGAEVPISYRTNYPHIFQDPRMLIWSESTSGEEVKYLLEFLVKQGFVNVIDRSVVHHYIANVSVTVEGYTQLRKTESIPKSNQAFVAMWFGEPLRDVYDQGIVRGIQDAGYRPFRIDNKEHNNKIDDEIIAEIRRSRFLVADFTCGLTKSEEPPVAIARGGVYYEAGFAQGLGIPVIWTCHGDLLPHVHFDTRQFNHIVWTSAGELRTALRNRIVAVIGQGPEVN